MKLSNLKIGTRLHIGFGVLVVLSVMLAAVSYLNFMRLNQANALNVQTYEVISSVDRILQSLTDMETGVRGYALTGNKDFLAPFTKGREAFNTQFAHAKSLTTEARQRARLQELEKEQAMWLDAALTPMIEMRAQITDNYLDSIITLEQAGRGQQGMARIRALLKNIVDVESGVLRQRARAAEQLNADMRRTLIGGGLIVAVLGVVLALLLTRNITGPLKQAVGLARRVATGDLTARVMVRSDDEIGQLMTALQEMNQSLVHIVGEVRQGTDLITIASHEIASGNEDLSVRTEQQASSLEHTASSMEELTAAVRNNADNARQASTLAISARDLAVKGGAVVTDVVQTMGSINASAKAIAEIISVIDGIAFQTNILALNAAVEAARAGEQGRGFAVVAAEVRILAQRSAGAAKEIKALIDGSVDKVNLGSRLVDEAGARMHEVVASVKRVTDIIGEIAGASDAQHAGIQQVNRSIVEMERVTQQNAALVEQAAAAAEAMLHQATQLALSVNVFQLDGTGAEPAATGPHRAVLPTAPAPLQLATSVAPA